MIIIKTSDSNFNKLDNKYFNFAVHKDDPTYYCLYSPNESTITNSDSTSPYLVSDIPLEFYQCCIPYWEFKYYSISEIQSEFNKLRPIKIEQLKTLINEERDRLCYEPISYIINNQEYLFKADAVSQQDITDAALQALTEGDSFSKDWVTYNGIVTLSKDDMIGLKYAIGYRRQNLVYQAANMKMQLESLSYEDLCLFSIQFN